MTEHYEVKSVSANPAPLGLLGFGLTTLLLNLHNIGLFELNTMILAMGVFYGGIAQIIAGVMEFKRNNTFGATAFVSYGFFWLTLVSIWINPFGESIAVSNPTAVGFYMLAWGILTFILFIATLKKSRISQIVFFTLVLLFLALAAHFWFGVPSIVPGVIGVICGSAAIYDAAAQIINEAFDKTVLPIGEKV